MSGKRICLAIALLVYATAHGKPLAYPGVAGDDGNIVDSAIDAGISTATAAATSYAGSVLETAQKVLENSSTPDAAILPDYLGKGLKWGGAAVSAGKAYTEWKNGNGCEAMYQALKGLAGFIPGFRGFLWQLGLEAAHLSGECIAGMVWDIKRLNKRVTPPDDFLEKLRRGCDEDNGAELAAEALKEDGTGIALAAALLGDDESKVPEAMRKFNESVDKSSKEVGLKFQKWQESLNKK